MTTSLLVKPHAPQELGVPEGTQGGSEPGHLTMGAGRVVWQPLEEINRAIGDVSFYEKKEFKDTIEYLRKTGGRLHLGGLLSDQGIHGTSEHLYALLEMARRNGLNDVFIHCFLDGRDVPKKSAKGFFTELIEVINAKGIGKISWHPHARQILVVWPVPEPSAHLHQCVILTGTPDKITDYKPFNR